MMFDVFVWPSFFFYNDLPFWDIFLTLFNYSNPMQATTKKNSETTVFSGAVVDICEGGAGSTQKSYIKNGKIL